MTTVPPVEKILEAHEAALDGVVASVFLPSGAQMSVSSASYTQGWQVEAWNLWKCVGELQSPTTYVARVVSRRIGWLATENGRELDSEETVALLEEATGSSDFEDLVRLTVLNMEVAGDLWLIREADGDDGRARWCVYSVVQPKLDEYKKDAQAAGRYYRRFYISDPTNAALATAPTSGVLDSALDLLTLTKLSRAQSFSRIAQAGILGIPTSVQTDGSGQPFAAGLEETMMTGIQDIDSASAVVPIVVRGTKEDVEAIRHITPQRQFDDRIPEKIDRATRRIALGMDFPPELLLGMGDQNHWNAWITQEETYRGTIAPLAETVAYVLETIVRETLGRDVQLTPDPTELLTRHATVADAVEAARLGAVSLDYVRRALGARDDDAQPEADTELIIRLGSGGSGEQSTTDTRSAPNEGVAP